MKPKVLLRIAAIFILLHTIGHTMGALTWTEPPTPKVGTVIIGMQTEHFDFMGRSVTLAAFFNGYGISMILVLLFAALQLWLLSNIFSKPMMVLMSIFLAGLAIVEFIYFFPLPAILTGVAAVCTGFSVALHKQKSI
ncbi:LIC_13387 family protein [Mucilaginibacter celer]|uniref:Uncharacterized protein n=1 Tax=Mucilaginibacter celer TaxID=2305508 RepID=A0A494VP45_9SPHI|nr:hypothetical protein [Mucilaginibacter celer]AYL96484.1 hypothetical protein HYN43_014775 [Mucilaginibacter celer]